MTPKTPFSLFAIAILLASAAASPASLAQADPSSPAPRTEVPEAPGLVLPSTSLCQWTDDGLAEHAPGSNGATFLAFALGNASVFFQATGQGSPLGPMPACPGRDAYPCPQALSAEAGYAILRHQVLCFKPGASPPSDPQVLFDSVCQLAASLGAVVPACPQDEPKPDGPEADGPSSGSPDSGSPQAPDGPESDCILTTLSSLDCPDGLPPACDLLGGFSSASSQAAMDDCVSDPCGDSGCNIGVCDGAVTVNCVCDTVGCDVNPCGDESIQECVCGDSGCNIDACDGSITVDCVCDALTGGTTVGTRADVVCFDDPCNGQSATQCVCGDGCSTGICEDQAVDDCVCNEVDCDPGVCGNESVTECVCGEVDCIDPVPCGGAGQDDCRTWLCQSAGQEEDCDPAGAVGPLAAFVVGAAVACATGTPAPAGAPGCPQIIAQLEAIVDDAVASVWPLANEVAQSVLACTRGTSSNACDQVRQTSDEAIDLLDDLALGTLGLAQACLDEMDGGEADTPLDCERAGEPGTAAQRYVGNVLLTFQEAVDTAQSCLGNVQATGSCQPPCDASCGSCDLCDPCGEAGCGPPVTLERSPPRPDLPPTIGRSFEVTLPDSGVMPTPGGGDVDHDGVPDLLDAVNLPSEAQAWTGDDRLSMPQGLGQSGFVLLIEPSHTEAQLVLADTGPDDVESLDASAALDLVALQHGLALRNALATVLHDGMTVHTSWVGIENPLDLALHWNEPRPADGTWLLVRNDPTRLVSVLELGGIPAPVALPAAAHYTALGLEDFRWEFLDLQGIPGFCFDAAGLHGLLPCTGHAEPEWLRAYSGQAAYALRSLQAGLHAGLVPVAADVAASLPAQVEAGEVNVRFPFPAIGALPVGDVRDDHDVDGDGRTQEGNGQLDAVESFLYIDPDEYQARAGDPFSGASAGWTLRLVDGTAASVTVRVGDVAGTPAKELLVVQALASNGAQAAAACAIRSGNGIAFYKGTTPFRQSASAPCGEDVPSWTHANAAGDSLGLLLDGYASAPGTPYRPLFTFLDADSNNLPEAVDVVVPDPASCGTGLHTCTGFTTLRIPITDAEAPTGPPTPPVMPPSAPTHIGAPQRGSLDVFDPASPIHLLGNGSMRLPDAVGSDYLLPLRGQTVSDVALRQWPQADPAAAAAGRLFHLSGSYIDMPAQPRDLVELDFLIAPADGNESAQDFLLNGRLLASYLDVRSDEGLVAETDATHLDGFTQELLDADGDGYLDLLVHIPHFSDAPLKVRNAHEETQADFWEIHLTDGPLTGWVSGSMGAVYRLDQGQLDRRAVTGLPGDQRTLGMSVLSDQEFFVVADDDDGSCDGQADDSSFIAHYYYGAWDLFRVSTIGAGFNCDSLYDIWMNPQGTFGFAGGSQGIWLRYSNGQWASLSRPTSCGIMDLEFTDSSTGYLAVAKADGHPCPRPAQGSPVMFYDRGTVRSQSVPGSDEMYDVSPDGTWAVGAQSSVYFRSGSSWIRDGGVPAGHYEGVDRDDAGTIWIGGWAPSRCQSCVVIASRNPDGSWLSHAVDGGPDRIRDLDMYSAGVGAAIGSNALVVIQPPPEVNVYDSVSPSSGLSTTVFTGQDQGSTSNVNGPLTHQWSWGDGAQSTGASASHTYSTLGWKDITHTVTDSEGNTGQKTTSVLVDAEFVGTVTSSAAATASGSMPSDGKQVSRHYRITHSGSLPVKVELLSGDSNLRLRGNLGSFVEGEGGWPYEGASERTLTGSVPNGGNLYFTVDRPAGAPGGAYSVRVSETTPTTLSSKMTPGTTPSEVTYLDRVHFSVTWRDSTGPSSAPSLILGGDQPIAMLAPSGALNYASGVTYSYEIPLTPGKSYQPVYKATQSGQDLYQVGAPVSVTMESVAHHDFAGDAEGSVPSGFSPVSLAGHCCNYWHVTNSDDARYPSSVEVGRHGNVLLFANKGRGTYQSTSSQLPGGAMETPTYDLRLATRPTLSFASYYETQDLNGTDQMTVLIASKDPAGSWSQWQVVRDVEGYEGGYKQWRTQAIDLAAYDGKQVKLRFQFQANGVDDDFLGWMIDDITVGTDMDGDHLADKLEAGLLQARESKALVPSTMDDTGHARSYVRRLDRPYASTLLLHAQMTIPNPGNTYIYVGAKNDYSDQASRVLVYDPSNPTRENCGASPREMQGFEAYRSGPIPGTYSSSGTQYNRGRLTFDAARCGFNGQNFLTQTNWFLELEDRSSDTSHSAVIEGLSLESVGTTNPLLADSDADGMPDSAELADLGRDPLGVDDDRDGKPEGSDANDVVADWIPAAMAQIDLNNRIKVGLTDLPAEIMAFSLSADFADGGRQQLPPKAYSKTMWTFQLPNQEATGFTFQWQDANGGHGVLAAQLHRYDAHGYALYHPTLQYTNDHVQYGTTTQNLYDNQRQEGDTAAFGLMDEVFPGPKELVESFHDVMKGATTAPRFGLVLLGFFVGMQFHPEEQAWPTAPAGVSYAKRGGSGPQYLYAANTMASEAGRNLSTSELQSAMTNGQVLAADKSGALRLLYEVPSGAIVLRVAGSLVYDAWKWQGNVAPDWENEVATDWFIQQETGRANALGGNFQQKADQRHCILMCGWRDQPTHRFDFQGALTKGFVNEGTQLPLDDEVFQSMRAAYDFQGYLGTTFKSEADNDALGDMSIGYAGYLASLGRLNSASNANHYWDGALLQPANCLSASSADLATRRCSLVSVSTTAQSYALTQGDGFRTHDLQWLHRSSNAVQFQDKIAMDAILSTNQGPAPPPGEARFEDTIFRMNGAYQPPAHVSGLYAALDWSTPIQPTIGIQYKENP